MRFDKNLVCFVSNSRSLDVASCSASSISQMACTRTREMRMKPGKISAAQNRGSRQQAEGKTELGGTTQHSARLITCTGLGRYGLELVISC